MLRANENNKYVFKSDKLDRMLELIEIERATFRELYCLCKII